MLRTSALLLAAIPSPSTNVVHVGPFVVHVYGLCYVLAVLAAVAIARRRWAGRGGSPELVYDFALWAVPAGIIGGRLYFLATTPGDAFEHWWGPLAVWEGGLGIWGGIAAGTLVGLWRVRRAGASLGDFLDAAAPTSPPRFLSELLWTPALAAALVGLARHRRVRPPGLFALYVTGYCAFR